MWQSTSAAILIAILGGMTANAADPPATAPQAPTTRPKSIFDPGLDPLPGSPGKSGETSTVVPGQQDPVVPRAGPGAGNGPAQEVPLPVSLVPPSGPTSSPAAPAATVPPQIAGGRIPLAGTVAELIRHSAQVDSPNYEAEAIVPRDGPREGWRTAPPIFQQTQAISYSHPKNNKNSGMAEFEVTRSGFLLLACNWNYQGNPSGGWVPTRLKQPDFIQRGWQPVDNAVFGGPLSRFESKGDQVLFIKHVEKGEKYTLRCNKYYPPYAIVFR